MARPKKVRAPLPPVEKTVPEPAPVKHPEPQEVAPGIVFLAHKNIYHADLEASGKVLNVGNFATLELAQAALSRAKADLNL